MPLMQHSINTDPLCVEVFAKKKKRGLGQSKNNIIQTVEL